MRADDQRAQPNTIPSHKNLNNSQGNRELGGYPLKELAKAPTKPPNPHRRQPDKTPAELIDEKTLQKQEAPSRKDVVVTKTGLGVLIVSAILGVIFMQASVFILLGIVGLALILIGMFLKI